MDDSSYRVIQPTIFGNTRKPSAIAEETPIGFLYNGTPYAVMMASPDSLDDFATGFSITEGLTRFDGLRGISRRDSADGIELDIKLAPESFRAFLARERVRSLRGHSSCGLCGTQDLAGVALRLPAAPAGKPFTQAAMLRALAALPAKQPLSQMTRAAHAAAWVSTDGAIQLVREDVGRHNALDKLIGAALRHGTDLAAGFCVITSRCSYEMVQKALMAGMPALVAISAPTALAVRAAEAAGLTLVALAREDGQLCYTGAERLVP